MTRVLLSLKDEVINVLYKQEIFESKVIWAVEFIVEDLRQSVEIRDSIPLGNDLTTG